MVPYKIGTKPTSYEYWHKLVWFFFKCVLCVLIIIYWC